MKMNLYVARLLVLFFLLAAASSCRLSILAGIDSHYRNGSPPCYPYSFMLCLSSYSYPHPVSMCMLTIMQVTLQLFCL